MEIVSINFVIFTIISLFIYHLLPDKFKSYWLLGISIFFYFSYSIQYALVLTLLLFINYFFGKSAYSKNRRFLFLIPLLINLGSFFFIKILSSDSLNYHVDYGNLFGAKVLLPIGFSYYILQLISFQLDVHNKKLTEYPNLKDFSLYLFYFPKVLSGPIEKPKQFLAKLSKPAIVDNALFSKAINLIILGMIRKLFIANILQTYLPTWNSKAGIIGWIDAISFVLYVYNDFAGYTLIVTGVSCLFGIELSPNFSNPLLSRNFSEFWNRWHISLSTWLRENIYYPVSRKLSRNSGKPLELFMAFVIPPMLTMLASGFWHKASPGLLLWGTILGLFMVIERLLFETWPTLKKKTQTGLGRGISSAIVLILYSFAMIPLASNSVLKSLVIWKDMLSVNGLIINDAFIPFIGLGAFSFFLDIMSERKGKQIWWDDFKLVPWCATMAGFILIIIISVILIAFLPTNVFIYQGF